MRIPTTTDLANKPDGVRSICNSRLDAIDDGSIAIDGLTHVRARIANPTRPKRAATIRFLVDSGAVYSVVPGTVLRRLGIEPHSSRTFILADGTEIRRKMSDATFRIGKHVGTSTVIVGEKDDAALLGAVSLESLGFVLDPLRRVLRPLPMVLGGQER